MYAAPIPSGWEIQQKPTPNLSNTPQPVMPSKPYVPPNRTSYGSHWKVTPDGFEAGGAYKVQVPGKPAGTVHDIAVKIPVPKPNMAKAIFRMVPFVGNAYALGEFLDELGDYLVDQNGNVSQTSISPGAYQSSGYSVNLHYPKNNVWVYSLSEYCSQNIPDSTWSLNSCTNTPMSGYQIWKAFYRSSTGQILERGGYAYAASSCPSGYYVSGTTCSSTTPTVTTPLTEQQFADKIAADSGWPTRDHVKLTNALEELTNHPQWINPDFNSDFPEVFGTPKNGPAVLDPNFNVVPCNCEEYMENGKKVTPVTPASTTTKTNSDGSIETTKTQTEAVTDGSKLQYREKSETSLQSGYGQPGTVTGSFVKANQETPTENPDGSEKKDENEPEFDTPEGEIPRQTVNLTYTEESFLGSGSCPADKYAVVHGETLKVFDWADGCQKIVTYAKPVILTIAAFIALLIIIPGGREAQGA